MEVEPNPMQTAIEEAKEASRNLHDRIAHHNAVTASVKKDLATNIQSLKNELDLLEQRLSGNLDEICAAENSRLGDVAAKIDAIVTDVNADVTALNQLVTDAHTELLVEQTYSLKSHAEASDLSQKYSLNVNKTIVDKWLHLGRRQAKDLSITVMNGRAMANFHFLTAAEHHILQDEGVEQEIIYRLVADRKHLTSDKSAERVEFVLRRDDNSFVAAGLRAGESYDVRVRAEYRGIASRWSEPAIFTCEFADCCAWRECPEHVDEDRRYAVSPANPRVATKTSYWNCTVVGDTALPAGRERVAWGIRIATSRNDNGSGVCVGVAPADIDQNTDRNFEECGWYIDCYTSTLWSGLPQTLWNEEYGPRKGKGEYVKTGDVVGVVMDMGKGELRFELEGKDLGVAFKGIPLDKPLVPCVVLFYKEDSVEIVF